MLILRLACILIFLTGLEACATSAPPNASAKRRFVAMRLTQAQPGDPLVSTLVGTHVPCCKDKADFRSRFGERVALTGIYKRTKVSRIRDQEPPPNTSGPVQLTLDNEAGWVMLGIYYEASGKRTVDEVKQFQGKRVVVYGRLHRNTPEMTHNGMVMQTMIGPYIDVQRIELAP